MIIDATSTLDGSLLLATKALSREGHSLDMDTAISQALELLEKRRKAIVLYSRSREFTASLSINAENVIKFIEIMKKYGDSIVKLRKSHPLEAIRLLSTPLF